MSYELVRSIIIKDNKVIIESVSNNVRPRVYRKRVSKRLTNILNIKGIKACEVEILKLYEDGMFQATAENRYTKALKKLFSYKEYNENFNWFTANADVDLNRKTKKEEFEYLLNKVLTK